MICELIASTLLCYTEPALTRADYRIDNAFTAATASVHVSFTPVIIERDPVKLRATTRDTLKRDKGAGRRGTPAPATKTRQHVMTASAPVTSPSLTVGYVMPQMERGSIFDVFKAPSKVPTISGIDMSQPGYKAVYAAAIKHGVDPNLALKVAWQESRGRCGETSSAGARGVMQVMPKTAKGHGVRNKDALYDCKTGAETGVKELKKLHSLTNGNTRKILIGYNCGPACIKRKTLPLETQNYIRKITGKK